MRRYSCQITHGRRQYSAVCKLIAISSVIETLPEVYFLNHWLVSAYYLYVEIKYQKTMIKSKCGDFLSLNTCHQFIFSIGIALVYDKLSPKDSSYEKARAKATHFHSMTYLKMKCHQMPLEVYIRNCVTGCLQGENLEV